MSLKLSFDGDEIVGSAAPRPRSLGSSAPAGVSVPAPTSRGQAHASVPREVPHFAEPRITLEQWQALVAVVDAGSYAKASEMLHKSQSTLTYGVQKLESLLGVKAFEIRGARRCSRRRASCCSGARGSSSMKRAGSSMRRISSRRAGKPRSPLPRTSSFPIGSCCSASIDSASKARTRESN